MPPPPPPAAPTLTAIGDPIVDDRTGQTVPADVYANGTTSKIPTGPIRL